MLADRPSRASYCKDGCTTATIRPPPRTSLVAFGAARRRRDFRGSLNVRTLAQSRAEIESSIVVILCIARCGLSLATMLRAVTLQSKSKRFLAAYGVPGKSTIAQRERIPLGELSLRL